MWLKAKTEIQEVTMKQKRDATFLISGVPIYGVKNYKLPSILKNTGFSDLLLWVEYEDEAYLKYSSHVTNKESFKLTIRITGSAMEFPTATIALVSDGASVSNGEYLFVVIALGDLAGKTNPNPHSVPKTKELSPDGAVMSVFYFCVVMAIAGVLGLIFTDDLGYAWVVCSGVIGMSVYLLGLYWPVIKSLGGRNE